MAFPPQVKTLEGLLQDIMVRLGLVERRLAKGGSGESSGPATAPYDAQPGHIAPFAGGAVPSGWLLCDGAAYPRSSYPTLFTAIGTTWGAGDGSTTFNVPNLKGRVLVGRDPAQTEFDVLGETGGAKSVALDASQMSLQAWQDVQKVTGAAGWITPSGTGTRWFGVAGVEGYPGGQPHNNLQPYAVANYIISTGSSVGGGGSSVPALPDPRTVISTADQNVITQAVGAWADITGCTTTFTLTYPLWVEVHFNAQVSGSTSGYGMIGVVATGALSLQPETEQVSGRINTYALTPFSTNANIKISGTKTLLLPAGTTTLTMQHRKSGTPNPSADYPVMIVTPVFWVGAPGATQTMTRGSSALRDTVYGVPATDPARVALANQHVQWFNTDKGWTEEYYAVTGLTGLTVPGLRATHPSGWYPVAGSPIYCSLRRMPAQAIGAGASVGIGFDVVLSSHGFTQSLPVPVVPVGGDYQIAASAVASQSAGNYINLFWTLNGVNQWAESGTVFPHTAAYSRAQFEPMIVPFKAGDTFAVTAQLSSAGNIEATSARLSIRYTSPPFA